MILSMIIALGALTSNIANAQSFEDYCKQSNSDYAKFVESANKEYAEFVKKSNQDYSDFVAESNKNYENFVNGNTSNYTRVVSNTKHYDEIPQEGKGFDREEFLRQLEIYQNNDKPQRQDTSIVKTNNRKCKVENNLVQIKEDGKLYMYTYDVLVLVLIPTEHPVRISLKEGEEFLRTFINEDGNVELQHITKTEKMIKKYVI